MKDVNLTALQFFNRQSYSKGKEEKKSFKSKTVQATLEIIFFGIKIENNHFSLIESNMNYYVYMDYV